MRPDWWRTPAARTPRRRLEAEVCPYPRFHFLGCPEGHPYQIHLHLLDARQGSDFLLGVGHELGARWARGRSQRHVDFDSRAVDSDSVDEAKVDDVQLEIRILHPAQRQLDLVFRHRGGCRRRFWRGRGAYRVVAHIVSTLSIE